METIRVKSKGPLGDDRELSIHISDGFIMVINTQTGELEVKRPVYGYEQHLWNWINSDLV